MGIGASKPLEQKNSSVSLSSSYASLESKDTALQTLPNAVLKFSVVDSYLDTNSQIAVLTTAKKFHSLFKEKISENELLRLVVRYEIKGKIKPKPKMQEEKELAIINPILIAIKNILQKNPELALKKGYITDNSGRPYYGSATEYAAKSRNWIVLKLLHEHVKRIPDGEARFAEQIETQEAQAFNYDLTLMPILSHGKTLDDLPRFNQMILISALDEKPYRIPDDAILCQLMDNQITTYNMVHNKLEQDKLISLNNLTLEIAALFPQPKEKPREIYSGPNSPYFEKLRLLCGYFPPLTNKPSLIKHFDVEKEEIKLTLWGELNGKWQLTEISNENKIFFESLTFPNSHSNVVYTIKNNVVTPEMYTALKKGHSLSCFILEELIQKLRFFVKNEPSWSAQDKWNQKQTIDYLCTIIGDAQRRLPAWIAQLWCTNERFNRNVNNINFNEAILRNTLSIIKVTGFKYYGFAMTPIKFYEPSLGFKSAIYRGGFYPGGLSTNHSGKSGTDGLGSAILSIPFDLAFMKALNEKITNEFKEFLTLLTTKKIASKHPQI